MTVLDASALLAWLVGEPGADAVETAEGAVCGAANWSEVVQKVLSRGATLDDVATAVNEIGLTVLVVTRADAERAARLRATFPALSLGDRLCLALAERLDVPALTADRAWAPHPHAQLIR